MRSNRASKTGIQLKMFRKQLTKQFQGLSIIHTVEQCEGSNFSSGSEWLRFGWQGTTATYLAHLCKFKVLAGVHVISALCPKGIILNQNGFGENWVYKTLSLYTITHYSRKGDVHYHHPCPQVYMCCNVVMQTITHACKDVPGIAY